MNEVTIFFAIIATSAIAIILGIIISKNNSNNEIETFFEDNAQFQNNLERQKVLEKLIRTQYTIKDLTILNTIMIIVLIAVIVIEKILKSTF